MLFNSLSFLLFLPIVTLLYYVIPHKYRYIWLLIASYFFYMCWNAKYALLLLFSTFITYLSSLLIEKVDKSKLKDKEKISKKKLIVAFSFIVNLLILFFFKYFDFALDNINHILSVLNMKILSKPFDVVLPVGISFYIFQALSYTMDVYRKDVEVEHNFFRYALFVSFFPQLVAGPIERSKNLIKQIYEEHKFKFENFKDGLLLMLWGFFLKIVIADRIAIVVDKIYDGFPKFDGVYIIVATILFAFQIYCDFYGYSIIATGAAKVMGFRLMENFNSPYFSKSVSEFWRRWHISLSSWFRDYLYIPLGGNRKGTLRKYINLMIVFLVSGLWHGANWSFVVWGLLNGLFQVIGSLLKKTKEIIVNLLHINTDVASYKMLQTIITFTLVDFTWIFFRADSFKTALSMIKSIFSSFNPWILFDESLFKLGLVRKEFQIMLVFIFVLLIVDYFKYKGKDIKLWLNNQNLVFRCFVYIFLILVILVFGKYGPAFDQNNFIYFQF